jgi:hypothetical protein
MASVGSASSTDYCRQAALVLCCLHEGAVGMFLLAAASFWRFTECAAVSDVT